MKKELTNMQVIKKVIWLFIKHRWKKLFITAIIWALIVSLVLYIEPLIINEILKKIEDFYKTWNLELNIILPTIYVLIWYSIFSVIINYIYNYYIVDKNCLKMHVQVSIEYMRKIIQYHYWKYLDKKPWSIYKNFDRWIDAQLFFLFSFFLDYIRVFFGLLVSIVIIFSINWKLSIAALSMVPLVIFMWIYFNKATVKKQNRLHRRWTKAFGHFWEALTNLSIVKTLRLENNFKNKFEKETDKVLEDQFSVSKRWQLARVYINWITTMSRAITLVAWIFLIKSWEIWIATLIVFYMYINYIYWPLNFIFQELRRVQENVTKSRIFFEEFDDIELDEDNNHSKDVEKVTWKIEFKNISFAYTDDKQTLENISFEINPWEKIALVWNTWAGKTTVTNLLIRFWEPDSWEILLDWQNIANITKSSLRKNIWLVMQDNTLFNETIRENLTYAKTEATVEDLNNALKLAKADFVFKLKDGLDTIIWERWLKLSWWEKQRLSIARIILKNPQILVLDEATSALDNKTEVEVKASLDELMKWKTSIIIAHRLSTVQNADKILVLENWRVVEAGTYDDLLLQKWKFYEIANPDRLVIA